MYQCFFGFKLYCVVHVLKWLWGRLIWQLCSNELDIDRIGIGSAACASLVLNLSFHMYLAQAPTVELYSWGYLALQHGSEEGAVLCFLVSFFLLRDLEFCCFVWGTLWVKWSTGRFSKSTSQILRNVRLLFNAFMLPVVWNSGQTYGSYKREEVGVPQKTGRLPPAKNERSAWRLL